MERSLSSFDPIRDQVVEKRCAIDLHSLLDDNYVSDISYETPFTYLPPQYLKQLPTDKFILVDATVQRMWCLENGVIHAYFVVSTGTEKNPTPTGDFQIGDKIKYAVSRRYYEDGETFWWGLPYYLDIGGFGIHAVPTLFMKDKEPLETLGMPASHRCVRLGYIKLACVGGKSPAQWVYEWADKGTPVRIQGEWDFEGTAYPPELPYRRFCEEKGFYIDEEGWLEEQCVEGEEKVAGGGGKLCK